MQLTARISSGEMILNGGMVLIVPTLPRSNNRSNAFHGRQSLIEALTSQHTQLKLSHVQPASMLGRVIELQPSQDPSSFLRLKGLIERAWRVGVQVVQLYLSMILGLFLEKSEPACLDKEGLF